MARVIGKLSARAVQTLSKPGRHSDGGGLYLSISPDGRRRWVFFYKRNGKQREMGLGIPHDVSLSQARNLAAECRKGLAAGLDPIEERDNKRRNEKQVPTFGEAADELIRSLEKDWTNEKHRYQWQRALEVEAKALRSLPVDKIGVEDVLKVLRPIWHKKPETAARVRNRIERVLDAQGALGNRSKENPARWRGNLDTLLAKRNRKVEHHRALPFDAINVFVGRLHDRGGMVGPALEFTILTAARTGEVIGATWKEIDFQRALWTVPADRMKADRTHEVPLSARAVAILKEAAGGDDRSPDDPIFHGPRRSSPISNMAMAMLMRRMEIDATPHGFRSTFRDWAGDKTEHSREIIEHALAHLVGDDVELAYRRSTALMKRRKLMNDWAKFIATKVDSSNPAPVNETQAAE